VALYLGRRDQYGAPLPAAGMPTMPTPRRAFEYRCFNLGVRDPDAIEELWKEARAAAEAKGKKRKRR
jgi:hypothetical protein